MWTILSDSKIFLPACVLLWILWFLFGVLSWFLKYRMLHSPNISVDVPFGLYPVSVIVTDEALVSNNLGELGNLESLFSLDYPEYELLFNLNVDQLHVVQEIERLKNRYPKIPIKILLNDNPQRQNTDGLMNAYQESKHNWVFLLADSVHLESNFLKKRISQVDPSIGAIVFLTAARFNEHCLSKLNADVYNSFFYKYKLFMFFLNSTTSPSQNILFRKKTVERVGGIGFLVKNLYRKNFICREFKSLGLKVVLASQILKKDTLLPLGVTEFLLHQSNRFFQDKKRGLFLYLCKTFLFNFWISGCLGLLATHLIFNSKEFVFLVIHACAFLVIEAGFFAASEPLKEFSYLRALLKEALVIVFGIGSLFYKTYSFRTRSNLFLNSKNELN